MSVYTVSLRDTSNLGQVNIGDGTLLANLSVAAGRGPKGDGWTGVTYDGNTGTFIFTSNDGLAYTSPDLRPELDNVDINSGTIDGTVIGGSTAAAGSFTTGSFAGDVSFGDNDKAIFGAGSDLQIYHNTHSYIEDAGGGDLILKASDQIKLQNGSGQNMAVFNENGAVVLTHSEDTKLATTSTGVDVTGTITSDGLTVDAVGASIAFTGTAGNNFITAKQGIKVDIDSDNNQGATSFDITHGGATGTVFSASETGDISFYEDTGTTPKFFWDASAESLGVGTSSPSATLDVSGTIKLDGNYPLGGDNVALGATALNSVESTGKWNVAIGDQALTNNTTGDGNVGIGRQALTTQTTALNNIAIGFQAGYSTTTGGHNVAIGSESFKANTTGISNVAVGRQSLFSSTTAINNVAVGYQAGRAITTGNNNTSVGYQSLLANTTGASNTALGYISLYANTTGNSNTSLGYASLRLNTTGNQNTAVGYQSLYDNTTGSNNTALGRSALANNTTGTNNTAIGDLAGSAITTGSGNTIIGSNIDGTAALADTVIIGSNNAERMRIDSSGNVGIGTTSPAHPLDVTGTIRSDVSTTGDFNFYATSDGGGAFRIYPDDATTANPTWQYQSNSSEDQAWVIGGVERMRIDSGGRAIIPAGVTLGTSAGVYNAANTLNDYEEGTWTPVISDGTNDATSNIAVGTYTKVGNLVHVQGRIVLSSLGSVSGAVQLKGLPFNSKALSNNFGVLVVGRASLLNRPAGLKVSGDLRSNVDYVNLILNDTNSGTSNMQSTEFTDDGDIAFSMQYITA